MAYTWKSSAILVLKQLGREATLDEIFNQITVKKLVGTDGQTPRLTLQTVLYRSELNRVSNKTISKPAKIVFYEKNGLWGLVEWLKGTSPVAPAPKTVVKAPEKPSVPTVTPPILLEKPPPSAPRPTGPGALLTDWEACLAGQIRQIELVGEITITAEEWEQLGRLIGSLLETSLRRGRTIQQLMADLRRHFPASFAALAVAQGVHGYGGIDGFWPGMGETLSRDIDPNWASRLGQLFEQILQDSRLPLFPDMGGRRYVDLILVHGGIPNISLGDYFDKMLKPAVTHSFYVDMNADELIDDWLSRSNTIFIDKPVLRFLEFGGQIAADFVDRTRELAREFLDSEGQIPDPEEVGLPRRVVEGFHAWAVGKNGLGPADDTSGEPRLRLRKPEIWLDPWGEGLMLNLPPQQIPPQKMNARIVWEVQSNGRPLAALPVQLRRAGDELRTTPEVVSLAYPAETYTVALKFDNQIQRTWRYQGYNRSSYPLLVFDPGRGVLLRQGKSLPARPLWIIFPRSMTLQIEGAARKTEEFPPLPWGGWANFQGEAWELAQATNLILRQGDAVIFETAIRPDQAAQKPHLVGGNLFMAASAEAPTPIYNGAPPTVRIPLVGRTSLVEELSRWRLTVQNPWPAKPDVTVRNRPLFEFRPQLIQKDGYVELPLDIPQLLGNRPTGTYTVRLRGPLGRDAELTFRVLAHFFVTGHEKIYLPDLVEGPQPVTLLLETSAAAAIECPGETDDCQVTLVEKQSTGATYEVTVPPEAVETRLILVEPLGLKKFARVPVRIQVRRLRWALAGDKTQADSGQLARTGAVIKKSLDALEQSKAPMLFVGHPLSDLSATQAAEPTALTLSLVDMEQQVLMQKIVEKPRLSHGRSVWRFDLAPFLDTVRHSTSPIVRFELAYPQPEGRLNLPVLSLTRSIVIHDVALDISPPAAGEIEFRLTWQEETRLRHRRVRFWPMWRPWLPPYELPIPDDAAGQLTFSLPVSDLLTRLPLGAYRLEFLVVDPWAAPVVGERPTVNMPNAAGIEMISAADRLAQIEQILAPSQKATKPKRGLISMLISTVTGTAGTVSPAEDKPTESSASKFELRLEQIHIYAWLGQNNHLKAGLEKCYDELDQAAIPHILALADLIQQTDNQRLLTTLQLKMFAPPRLKRLLTAHAAGEITQAQYEAYFKYLPRAGLLSLPTCEILLTLPDVNLQLYAVLQLVHRDEPLGVVAAVGLVKSKHLSVNNAVQILKLNLKLAKGHLENHLDDPVAGQLLAKISPNQAIFIRVNDWVHSLAGWGQITQIINMTDGKELEQFVKGQSEVRLNVTLRPGSVDTEPIVVEILSSYHRVQFNNSQKRFRCEKSKHCGFITTDQNLLISDHNRVHGGLNPQFSIEQKQKFISTLPLQFRGHAPFDLLR